MHKPVFDPPFYIWSFSLTAIILLSMLCQRGCTEASASSKREHDMNMRCIQEHGNIDQWTRTCVFTR